jgi:hypothetical protein
VRTTRQNLENLITVLWMWVKVPPFKVEVTPYLSTPRLITPCEAGSRAQSELTNTAQGALTGRYYGELNVKLLKNQPIILDRM